MDENDREESATHRLSAFGEGLRMNSVSEGGEAAMNEKAFFRHSSFNAGGHVQLVGELPGICKTLSLMAACQVH